LQILKIQEIKIIKNTKTKWKRNSWKSTRRRKTLPSNTVQ